MDQINLVIACGLCQTPLQGPADPKPDDILTCPNCGNSDKVEAVTAEVGEFLKEQTAKAFQAVGRKAFGSSRNITIREHPIPERSYRFIGIRKAHDESP